MVTGYYPWSIGIHQMLSCLVSLPRCMTQELKDAGCRVSWPTKLDFNFESTDDWCHDRDYWGDRPGREEPFFVYQNFIWAHESRMFDTLPEWHGTGQDLPFPDPLKHDHRYCTPAPYLSDCPELRSQIVGYYNGVTYIDQLFGERLKWFDDQGFRDYTLVIFLSDHGCGLPRSKRWCYDAGLSCDKGVKSI